MLDRRLIMFSHAGYSLGLHSPAEKTHQLQVSEAKPTTVRIYKCRFHTAKLLGSVLEVGDIGLAALVRHGVVFAPLGGDPAEVAARIFSLSIVTHGCGMMLLMIAVPGGRLRVGEGLEGAGTDCEGIYMLTVWEAARHAPCGAASGRTQIARETVLIKRHAR